MTKLELRTAIKQEARIQSAANLDTLVDGIVADLLTDYCNKARFYELLKEGVPITLVAAQQSYALPVDYQNLDQVRYGVGPLPQNFRVVDMQPPTVKQTYSITGSGWPRFYRLTSGPKISFYPYGAILATDVLTIDYFILPMSIYTTDSSPFPVPRLESAVKKDAIARIQRFHSANQEAQMTDADGNASFVAGQGASSA